MRLQFAFCLLYSWAVWTSALPYGGAKGYQPPSQYQQSRGDKLIDDGVFDQSEGEEFVVPDESQSGGIVVGPYDYEMMDTQGPDSKGKESLKTVDVEHPGELLPAGEDSFNTDLGKTDLGQEHPAIAQEEKGQGGANSWLDTLAQKWNFVKDKTKAAADSLQDSVQSVYESVQNSLPGLWENFKAILVNSGKMVHRGAEYVVQKVAVRFEEAKASEVIKKLQHRLEQGEEAVSDFFRQVGEKATSWMKQHDNVAIDNGLLQETQEFGAHFADPTFPDLFQDKEIQVQVNRLVHVGVLTQDEANHLFQNKQQEIPNEEIYTAPSDSEIQVALDNSAGKRHGTQILFKDEKLHHGKNYGNEHPAHVQPKPSISLKEESLPGSEHPGSTYGNEPPVDVQPEPSILLKEESLPGSEHPGSAYGNIHPVQVQSKPSILLEESLPGSEHPGSTYENEYPVDVKPEPSILLKEESLLGSEQPGSTYGNEHPVQVQSKPSILLEEESIPGSEHPGSTYGNEFPVDGQPEPSILLKEESTLGNEHPGSTYGNEYPVQVQSKPSILLEESPPGSEHPGSTYGNESPVDVQPEPSILLKEESILGSEHPESTYGNEYPVEPQSEPSILLKEESLSGIPGSTYGNEYPVQVQSKPSTVLEEDNFPGSEHRESTYGNEFPVIEEIPVSVLVREEEPQQGQTYGYDSHSVHENEASVVDLQGSSDYEPQGGGVATYDESFDPHHTVKKELLGPEQIDQQRQNPYDQVQSTYPDSSINQIQTGMSAIAFPNNW